MEQRTVIVYFSFIYLRLSRQRYSRCPPMSSCFFTITANEKVLWKLGDLKLVRPNVRPYKLLYFNYLQMFGSFRPPKQKYKRIPNVQLLPSAPIATILCWRLPLLSVAMRIQNKGHKYQHQ
jgi:hypothetical protein